jgi:hypothetical protein
MMVRENKEATGETWWFFCGRGGRVCPGTDIMWVEYTSVVFRPVRNGLGNLFYSSLLPTSINGSKRGCSQKANLASPQTKKSYQTPPLQIDL